MKKIKINNQLKLNVLNLTELLRDSQCLLDIQPSIKN